jgi:CheY-like chemotaxis protein
MSALTYTVLVTEPDARLRALLVNHLAPLGCTVLQAANGETAFQTLTERHVHVVLSELYMRTDMHDDLIRAIRSTKTMRHTRTIAHTRRGTPRDREWATEAGADAFLIYPTRAERLRYVVGRLASERGTRAATPAATPTILRRRSLDKALREQERGGPAGMTTIVVGREWWTQLTPSRQSAFRKRAKSVGVSLRSDSLLGDDYVVVRTPSRAELAEAAKRPAASPYRDRTA